MSLLRGKRVPLQGLGEILIYAIAASEDATKLKSRFRVPLLHCLVFQPNQLDRCVLADGRQAARRDGRRRWR